MNLGGLQCPGPRFAPNNAYEGGVYLRWIVDNYDRLPPVMAFLQADAGHKIRDPIKRISSITPSELDRLGGYVPLNDFWIPNRNFGMYKLSEKRYPEVYPGVKPGMMVARAEACWKSVSTLFGRADLWTGVPKYRAAEKRGEVDKAFTVSTFCCAYFAVSRANIQAVPLSTWRRAYEQLVVNGTCVPGIRDTRNGKWEAGHAMEHLAHIIFGPRDQPPHYNRVLRPWEHGKLRKCGWGHCRPTD